MKSHFYNVLSDSFILYIELQSFIDLMYSYIVVLLDQFFYSLFILWCYQTFTSSLMSSQFCCSTFFLFVYPFIYRPFIYSEYLCYHLDIMCLFVDFY